MMNSAITRVQAHYLEALLKAGSFAAAAQTLHISQPALTMQIQRLERIVGGALVNRASRPIQATPLAQKLLPHLLEVLRRFEDLEDAIADQQEHLKGHLHIAAIPTIAPYLLPTILPKLVDAHPDIQMDIEELPTEQLLEAILQERVDVGIMALPISHSLQHLDILPMWTERLWVYHLEGACQSALTLDALKKWPTYLLAQGHCLRDHVMGLCDPTLSAQRQGLHYQSGSLETLMRLVDHQGGITIIPDMARNQLSKAQQAANTSAIASDLAQRQIVIVFKHTLQKKRLLEALRIGTLSYLQSHA